MAGIKAKWYSDFGKQKFLKCNVNLWASNSTLRYIYPREISIKMYANKKTWKWISSAALFIIANNWKQPKCPSTSEWTSKMWSILTMEYYSPTTRNELWTHGTTMMNLKYIMLNERSLIQKITSYIIVLYDSIYKKCSQKTKL